MHHKDRSLSVAEFVVRKRVPVAAGVVFVGLLLFAAADLAQDAEPVPPPSDVWKRIFARPTTTPAPSDNPLSDAKVELGRRLFADRRLSGDSQRSCVTCHDPQQGFSDGRARALGRDDRPLRRNAPALWNLAWGKAFYWDGREPSLEAQARVPITHRNEMAGDFDEIARVLNGDKDMRGAFRKAFPEVGKATPKTIVAAIASYERSLVSPPTRFDRWIAGDDKALTMQEYRGFALFAGRAGCLSCHGGWRFSDERFHDIGLKTDDLGRGAMAGVTPKVPMFKTPGLRELTSSAPYMHDGSKRTLEAVVAHYAGGFERRPSLAANIVKDLRLSVRERAEIVAFLKTLSRDE